MTIHDKHPYPKNGHGVAVVLTTGGIIEGIYLGEDTDADGEGEEICFIKTFDGQHIWRLKAQHAVAWKPYTPEES